MQNLAGHGKSATRSMLSGVKGVMDAQITLVRHSTSYARRQQGRFLALRVGARRRDGTCRESTPLVHQSDSQTRPQHNRCAVRQGSPLTKTSSWNGRKRHRETADLGPVPICPASWGRDLSLLLSCLLLSRSVRSVLRGHWVLLG